MGDARGEEIEQRDQAGVDGAAGGNRYGQGAGACLLWLVSRSAAGCRIWGGH
jgi:hypothetical protein